MVIKTGVTNGQLERASAIVQYQRKIKLSN